MSKSPKSSQHFYDALNLSISSTHLRTIAESERENEGKDEKERERRGKKDETLNGAQRFLLLAGRVNMLIQFISRHAARPIRLCPSLAVYIRVHFPRAVRLPSCFCRVIFPARGITPSRTYISARLSRSSDVTTSPPNDNYYPLDP